MPRVALGAGDGRCRAGAAVEQFLEEGAVMARGLAELLGRGPLPGRAGADPVGPPIAVQHAGMADRQIGDPLLNPAFRIRGRP